MTPRPQTITPAEYLNRDYQLAAYYQANTLLNASRSPVLVIPTGTGKTRTSTAIISARVSFGRRVFVLAPSDETFTQWVAECSNAGLNPGTIDSNGILGRDRGVYICMPQSLVNILHRVPEAIHPDEVVIDELHHAAADTWVKILAHFNRAIPWGMTATPARTDGKALDPPFTDIVQTITMKEAVRRKYLATPLPIVPRNYFDNFDIPDPDSDKGLEAQREKMGKTEIIGDVIEAYGDVFSGLPVLVACATFEHAKLMTDQFRANGWKFEHIHSNLSKHERKRMLRGIRSGELNGLCTVGIGIEGMDIPGLYGLIWLRRTASLIIYLQFIGRCLRPLPGKKYGIILDPVGNLFIHGWPDAERTWTLSGKSEADAPATGTPTMKICPFCGVANATENITCHFCMKELYGEEAKAAKTRQLPTIIDGELVAVLSDGQRENLRERVKAMQEEGREGMKVAASGERDATLLTGIEKKSILVNGLFSGKERRPLFNEAVLGLRR